MATFVDDTFTGAADNDNLTSHVGETGATWTMWSGAATVAKLTAAGTMWPNGSGFANASGTPANADYSVFGEVADLGGARGAEVIGLLGRSEEGATINNYTVRFVASASQLILFRVVAGAGTQIGATATITLPSAGNMKLLELRMTGTTIEVYYDGAQVITGTDTQWSAKSKAGVRVNGTGSLTTGLHFRRVYAVDSVSESVTVTDKVSRSVIQRTVGGTSKSVTLSGIFVGSPVSVQVRVEGYDSAATVVDWTTATLGSGTFTAAVTVPQGGWYRFKARSLDGSQVVLATSDGTNRWGVGINIAVAGQSNAIGFGDTVGTTPSDTVSYFNGTIWVLATEPLILGAGSGVPCANELAADIGVPIGIVMPNILAALIGDEDGTNWNFRNESNHSDTLTVYGDLLTDILAASGIEFIIWSQGATDAVNGETKAGYIAAMDSLHSFMAEDVGDVTWIVSTVGRTLSAGSFDTGYNSIRAAHQEWDNGDDQLNISDTMDYAIINPDMIGGNTSHYGGASMQRRGIQEAIGIEYSLGLVTRYGAPRILGFFFTNDARTAIRVSITHTGGTDFTPTTGILGFVVTDTVGAKTISSAERESASAILLTLSTACVGATTATYLAGKNPSGPTGLVVDNQTEFVALRTLGEGATVQDPVRSSRRRVTCATQAMSRGRQDDEDVMAVLMGMDSDD